MIFELLLLGLFNLLSTVIGALPTVDIPSVLTSLDSRAAGLGEYAAPLAYWFPWVTITDCVAAAAAVFAVVGGVRFTLWVWAHLPFIGKGS